MGPARKGHSLETGARGEPRHPGRMHLEKRLIAKFEELSPQLQAAARYLLDHPHDVALSSMRELAREARLPPATLTRLARQVGFPGFEELQRIYVDDVRRYAAGYRSKAIALADASRSEGETNLASEIVTGVARQVDAMADVEVIRALVDAAEMLSRARRVYCVGQRLSFPPAYTFHYIHGIAGGSSVLVDGPGGTGLDLLRQASADDAVLVISVHPYTRVTIEQALFAHHRRVPIVAITDSEVSPLVRIASRVIRVGTKSKSFFQTMTAVLAAAETLAALIAMHTPESVLAGLKRAEDYFADRKVYWTPSGNHLSAAISKLSQPEKRQRARSGRKSRRSENPAAR
jgi:DNA-binding MurR/RpiR family transcriptional regulator